MSKKKPTATEPCEESKGGRPSSFKPEYCDLLLDHMEKGYSFESFAGVVRKSKQTIYDWTEANAEFLDAKKVGLELSRLYWERKAIDHMNGVVSKEDVKLIRGAIEDNQDTGGPVTIKIDAGYFNNTLWIFNMKNRFGWRDKQDIEHSGPDGKPLGAQNITVIIPDNGRNKK